MENLRFHAIKDYPALHQWLLNNLCEPDKPGSCNNEWLNNEKIKRISSSGEKWLVIANDTPFLHLYHVSMALKERIQGLKLALICLYKFQGMNEKMREFFDEVIIVDRYRNVFRLLDTFSKEIPVISFAANSIFGALFRLLKPTAPFHLQDVWSTFGKGFSEDKLQNDAKIEAEQFLCREPGFFSYNGHPERVKKIFETYGPIRADLTSYLNMVIPSRCRPVTLNIRQGNWKIAWAGKVGPHSPSNVLYDPLTDFLSIFKRAVDSGVQLTVYPVLGSRQIKDYQGYIDLANRNPRFVWSKPASFHEMEEILSHHHFGMMIKESAKSAISPLHYQCQFASRIFTFMTAGIPMIVSPVYSYLAELVETYHLGIVLADEEIDNLTQILDEIDTEKIKKGIENFRKDYSIEKTIQDLLPKISLN